MRRAAPPPRSRASSPRRAATATPGPSRRSGCAIATAGRPGRRELGGADAARPGPARSRRPRPTPACRSTCPGAAPRCEILLRVRAARRPRGPGPLRRRRRPRPPGPHPARGRPRPDRRGLPARRLRRRRPLFTEEADDRRGARPARLGGVLPSRARPAAWSPSASSPRPPTEHRALRSLVARLPGLGAGLAAPAPPGRRGRPGPWPSTRAGRSGWPPSRPGCSPGPERHWGSAAIAGIGARIQARMGAARDRAGTPARAGPRAAAWPRRGLPTTARTACEVAETLWLLDRRDHLVVVERALRDKALPADFRFPMTDARLALARLCALDARHDEARRWFDAARDVLDTRAPGRCAPSSTTTRPSCTCGPGAGTRRALSSAAAGAAVRAPRDDGLDTPPGGRHSLTAGGCDRGETGLRPGGRTLGVRHPGGSHEGRPSPRLRRASPPRGGPRATRDRPARRRRARRRCGRVPHRPAHPAGMVRPAGPGRAPVHPRPREQRLGPRSGPGGGERRRRRRGDLPPPAQLRALPGLPDRRRHAVRPRSRLHRAQPRRWLRRAAQDDRPRRPAARRRPRPRPPSRPTPTPD